MFLRVRKAPGGRPIRVFACFLGERQRAKEGPGGRFIRVLQCFPDVWPASYVFLRVGGSFTSSGAAWRRLAPFAGTVISCMPVAFWQDHTVKHVPRAMAPKPPQYRELRSLEAESLRSLAPLREVGLARRGAARSSAADPRRFASPAALLELRRDTWRGAAE